MCRYRNTGNGGFVISAKERPVTLRAYEYGDPLKVLERKESKTCKGCQHLKELWGQPYCNKGRKMIRCKFYLEKPCENP